MLIVVGETLTSAGHSGWSAALVCQATSLDNPRQAPPQTKNLRDVSCATNGRKHVRSITILPELAEATLIMDRHARKPPGDRGLPDKAARLARGDADELT